MVKKILYPALFIFIVWLFASGIPIDFYSRGTSIFSFIGSALGAVALFMSFFYLAPKEEADDKEGSPYGCIAIAASVAFLFGFGIFLIFHTDSRVEKEFKEHGIYTMATIKDGSSMKGRSFDLTSVKVFFYNEKGEKRYADIDMSSGEFKGHFLEEQLPIVYSKRYPTMAKIIHDDEEYMRYANIKVRPIQLSDLIHLFELEAGKATNDYLNTINQKWEFEYSYVDSTYTYMNEVKKTGIKTGKNGVEYISMNADTKLFREELKAGGYTVVSGKPEMPFGDVVYSNGSHMIARSIQQLTSKSNKANPSKGFGIEVVTIFYIAKPDHVKTGQKTGN